MENIKKSLKVRNASAGASIRSPTRLNEVREDDDITIVYIDKALQRNNASAGVVSDSSDGLIAGEGDDDIMVIDCKESLQRRIFFARDATRLPVRLIAGGGDDDITISTKESPQRSKSFAGDTARSPDLLNGSSEDDDIIILNTEKSLQRNNAHAGDATRSSDGLTASRRDDDVTIINSKENLNMLADDRTQPPDSLDTCSVDDDITMTIIEESSQRSKALVADTTRSLGPSDAGSKDDVTMINIEETTQQNSSASDATQSPDSLIESRRYAYRDSPFPPINSPISASPMQVDVSEDCDYDIPRNGIHLSVNLDRIGKRNLNEECGYYDCMWNRMFETVNRNSNARSTIPFDFEPCTYWFYRRIQERHRQDVSSVIRNTDRLSALGVRNQEWFCPQRYQRLLYAPSKQESHQPQQYYNLQFQGDQPEDSSPSAQDQQRKYSSQPDQNNKPTKRDNRPQIYANICTERKYDHTLSPFDTDVSAFM